VVRSWPWAISISGAWTETRRRAEDPENPTKAHPSPRHHFAPARPPPTQSIAHSSPPSIIITCSPPALSSLYWIHQRRLSVSSQTSPPTLYAPLSHLRQAVGYCCPATLALARLEGVCDARSLASPALSYSSSPSCGTFCCRLSECNLTRIIHVSCLRVLLLLLKTSHEPTAAAL
jgi:hypothetical protein